MEKRKVVANSVFTVSSVGISYPRTSRYGGTLFTSSIVKTYDNVGMLT